MDVKDFTCTSSGRLIEIQKGLAAFVPAPLPPKITITAELMALAEKALIAIGEFRGLLYSLPDTDLLAQTFLRREAVLSSQIEGTRSDLGQLLLFEVGQGSEDGLLDRDDAAEVYNYVAALEHAVAMLEEIPICERLIKSTHFHLLQGVRGERKNPGEYRRVQNWIGQGNDSIERARYVPPPVEEMLLAMRNFEQFLNVPSELPILIQLALVHYQFEAIHPFNDGNGRLGRLLLLLLLKDRDILPWPILYLSAYLLEHRKAYTNHLLSVSMRGEWSEWIEFFLIGIHEQALDAVHRSRNLLDLRNAYQEEFQRKNAGSTLMLIDALFRSPVLTIKKAEQLLNVTFKSASRHVGNLQSAGILVEVTGKSKNRIFLAEEILDILQRKKA